MAAIVGAGLQVLAIVMALFIAGIAFGVLGVLGVVALACFLVGQALAEQGPGDGTQHKS